MKKFWNWIKNSDDTRILRLEGPIDEESFWGDEITPQMFRDELESGEGDVTVWINSPGGNVFAAAEIYTMLRDYKGSITVKIDAIAASAASVVAMAGDTVQMSPVAMLMIHDPSTVAMGNTKDMEKAIEVLNEVKESIINAYAAKSGLSHARIANLMSNETWMNAKKAVELGFADEILFAKKEEEPDSDPADPENPEEDPDSEPGEGEEKKPFQKDTAGHLFSSRQMDLIVLNRLGVKPEDVGQKHTEPKEPPADPKPSAEPTPPAEPPANSGPILDMDGKTEDGSIPYNLLMKQLEYMKCCAFGLFFISPQINLWRKNTMSKILELRTKRNTLWEQTKDFLEKNRGENGLVKAEAVEQYNKMAQEVKDLGAEIERLEQQAQIEAQLSAPTSSPVHADPKNGSKKDVKPTATAEYAENFWNMIRNRGHYGEVRNALSVGEDTEGGFTVPDEFEKKLVEALEENNIFRGMATVIRTSSGTRKIPIAEDTGEASWIDEGEEIPESDTTFGQTMLSAYKLGTMIKISNELLNDSAFDLATYIARRFGVRMGNAEERAFITGDGVGKPLGLLAETGGAKVGVTAAQKDAVTFDEIFKLYYALKAPYRKKAQFLCNEALVLQLMTIKDNNGNYIWKPGLEIGKPDTLLNRPLKTSAFMPEIKGGSKVMAFGDYSYYWVADRQNRTFRRLNELYARTDQVGFLTTQRVDGKLILPEAVQLLQMAPQG